MSAMICWNKKLNSFDSFSILLYFLSINLYILHINQQTKLNRKLHVLHKKTENNIVIKQIPTPADETVTFKQENGKTEYMAAVKV